MRCMVVAVSEGGCLLHVRHRPWWVRWMDPPPIGRSQRCIAVRVAAGDMPEGLLRVKQDAASQPRGKAFVEESVLRRHVYLRLLGKDVGGQHVVANVLYGWWPFQRSLAEGLLARGLAEVTSPESSAR